MENSDDVDAKQNYLREEIIDQDYDPEEFLNYLNNIKGEEVTELNNISMQELVIVLLQI